MYLYDNFGWLARDVLEEFANTYTEILYMISKDNSSTWYLS